MVANDFAIFHWTLFSGECPVDNGLSIVAHPFQTAIGESPT